MPSKLKLSKFLSLVLRHRPEAIGLCLDKAGWINISELVKKACKAGRHLTTHLVIEIVAESDKQRFQISPDGLRIRACQGHSIPVELGIPEVEPPNIFYHGTARRNFATIRREGIRRGKRNYVHLSTDESGALEVGRRHGQPVVIMVQAAKMYQNGIKFFQAENGVWLTEYVAPEYLLLDPRK